MADSFLSGGPNLPFVLLLALVGARATIVGDPILVLSPLFAFSALGAYHYFTAPRRTANRRARDERQRAKILFEIGDDGVLVKDDYEIGSAKKQGYTVASEFHYGA